MNLWRTYNPSLFVNRPTVLDGIRAWADAPAVEKRVLSLVGPPGSGKTWILKKLYEEWEKNRFVVWLDIPSVVDRARGNIDALAFRRWIDKAVDAGQEYCSSLSVSSFVDVASMAEGLANQLCQCNLDKAPLVLVDGYDEIEEERTRKILCMKILQPLVEKPCMRLIIAHRDQYRLEGDALRRNQTVLSLLLEESDEFAMQQFERLFTQARPSDPLPAARPWMKRRPHYRWNHPFLNHFLFERGLSAYPSPALRDLSVQDLYEAIQEAISRPDEKGKPRYTPLSQDEFRTLHRLANELPDAWSPTDVQARLGVHFFSDARIGRLCILAVVVQIPDKPLYQVSDGIRELLREIELDKITRW